MFSAFESVTPTVRYAKSPTCIGVVTHGDRALLIDTGLDENLVRKVVNTLTNEGVHVAAIVNTHSHADHCGGNAFVQRRVEGVVTAAPAYEHLFIERPDLEPWSLYGAPAPGVMRTKFLQATPSRVDDAIAQAGTHDVAGFDVTLRALPGHSVNQMGVEVDGVLFVGDALLPPALIDKYGLLFAVDPLEAERSAARLATEAPPHVVAYHGGLLDDVAGAAKRQADVTRDVVARIERRLEREASTAEDLLVDVLDAFPPSNPTVELHALLAATMRGYLSALERDGRVVATIEAHRMLWRLRKP